MLIKISVVDEVTARYSTITFA